MRQTFRIAPMLAHVNFNLRPERKHSEDTKRTLCNIAEMILHSSGNYKGFHEHTPTLDGPCGYSRHYYVHDKLKAEYNEAYYEKVALFGTQEEKDTAAEMKRIHEKYHLI